jgi:hypothetical protein
MRRIASVVFVLVSVLIMLGALGHDSNAAKLHAEFDKVPAFDATAAAVIFAVWHFCSGCMVLLGLICLGVWWRATRHGDRTAFVASDLIGAFYVIVGIVSVPYTGKPFFWVFTALGALLILASLPLRRA